MTDRIDFPAPKTGGIYLAEGGTETEMLFLRGRTLPEFAMFPLLEDPETERELREMIRGMLEPAARHGLPVLLGGLDYRASPDWGAKLGYSPEALAEANIRSIDFLREAAAEFGDAIPEVRVAGIVGPRGDAYARNETITAEEAEAYHATQLATLRRAGADLAEAMTFNNVEEAIGLARAAREAGLPLGILFTLDSDSRLAGGPTLREAVERVDDATDGAPAFYGINCSHPAEFEPALEDGDWLGRIRALRPNAAMMDKISLCKLGYLEEGDPEDLARRMGDLARRMPQVDTDRAGGAGRARRAGPGLRPRRPGPGAGRRPGRAAARGPGARRPRAEPAPSRERAAASGAPAQGGQRTEAQQGEPRRAGQRHGRGGRGGAEARPHRVHREAVLAEARARPQGQLGEAVRVAPAEPGRAARIGGRHVGQDAHRGVEAVVGLEGRPGEIAPARGGLARGEEQLDVVDELARRGEGQRPAVVGLGEQEGAVEGRRAAAEGRDLARRRIEDVRAGLAPAVAHRRLEAQAVPQVVEVGQGLGPVPAEHRRRVGGAGETAVDLEGGVDLVGQGRGGRRGGERAGHDQRATESSHAHGVLPLLSHQYPVRPCGRERRGRRNE
jgi:S-methylmethionine-dependent homocysteine/selenocysteine methylase